jgi:hypothetical protein
MNTPLDASQKEELRHAVRAVIVGRHPNAHPARALTNAVALDVAFRITPEDTTAALEFLRSKGEVEIVESDLGATRFWRATAAGILAQERAEAAR